MLAGVEGTEIVIEIDDPNIEGAIGLEFDWLADAKLVLTDELVAETLRARKHAFNEADFDEIEAEEDIEGEIRAPELQKDA